MKGGRRGGESSVIPESVMEATKRSLANMEDLRVHLLDFLALAEPEVLAQMPPLHRAQVLFIISKAASTLVTLRLRCSGVHPDNHPVKTEIDRLNLYQEKLERNVALSKAPLRPSTMLNYRAATRFIEHSLPDLTTAQKQSMRDISRGESRGRFPDNRSSHKKRKYPSSEKKSVQSAAQEFLEKATRELLGANKSDLKGPLRIETSDEEDMTVG